MKTNYFLLLLILFPFIFTSCGDDDKDKTEQFKTYKVKYEIVPVNQEDYGIEATGMYSEFRNNKLYSVYLSGSVFTETDLKGNVLDVDIKGDREILANLPWSYETTSVNFSPPVLNCSTGEGTELILKIYIDGVLYKEEKQRSPAGLTCYELLEL